MNAPQKVLCLTEGKDLEPKFFKTFARQLGLNIEIFQVRTNIYALYQHLKKENFQLDIKTAVASLPTSQSDKSVLSNKYLCTYLIYDLDLQHSQSKWPWRIFTRKRHEQKNLAIVRQMAAHFNDEYDETVGKLLINYPMMESFKDSNSFFMEEYRVRNQQTISGKKYKRLVSGRAISHIPPSSYSRQDFSDLISQNAYKLSWILHGQWAYPSRDVLEEAVDQTTILSKQEDILLRTGKLPVLNTSILLPLLAYKESAGYYASCANPRPTTSISLIVPLIKIQDARCAQKLIESLTQQSLKTWECLLVCSTALQSEAATSLRQRLDDPRIKFVTCSATVINQATLLNVGVSQATGELTLFSPPATITASCSLITIHGLFSLHPDTDVITFSSRNKLLHLLHRTSWPVVRKASHYNLSKGHAVRKALEKKAAETSLFDVCYSRCALAHLRITDTTTTLLDAFTSSLTCLRAALLTDATLFIH